MWEISYKLRPAALKLNHINVHLTLLIIMHTPKKLKLAFYYWPYQFSELMWLVLCMPVSGFSYHYPKLRFASLFDIFCHYQIIYTLWNKVYVQVSQWYHGCNISLVTFHLYCFILCQKVATFWNNVTFPLKVVAFRVYVTSYTNCYILPHSLPSPKKPCTLWDLLKLMIITTTFSLAFLSSLNLLMQRIYRSY